MAEEKVLPSASSEKPRLRVQRRTKRIKATAEMKTDVTMAATTRGKYFFREEVEDGELGTMREEMLTGKEA